MVTIRPEGPDDRQAVYRVNREAFGGVSTLRAPVDAFLVLGREESALDGFRGLVEYPAEFSQVTGG
jgi:predicted N-acetyltransferase YhbS